MFVVLDIKQNGETGERVALAVGDQVADWVQVEAGSRHEDLMSPTAFIKPLERCMDRKTDSSYGVKLSGRLISDLRLDDEVDLLDEQEDGLRDQIEVLVYRMPRNGASYQRSQRQIMLAGKRETGSNPNVRISKQDIECVEEEFICLGSVMTAYNDYSTET